MHRTALGGHAAAFRVPRGTTVLARETGPVVVGALQELDALLRRAGARRRQRRAADDRGDDVGHVRVIVAVPQERVEVVLLVGGRQIVDGRPGWLARSRRDVLVGLAARFDIVLPAVELAQVRLLVAPGRPTAALPPSLGAEDGRASPSR